MQKQRWTVLAGIAAGLATAVTLGISAAQADTYTYTLDPDTGSYFGPIDGLSGSGLNISTNPFQEVLSGTSYIAAKDVTSGATFNDGELYGQGTETLNPYTGAVESWNLIETNPSDGLAGTGLVLGSQIDVMELGGGFANQVVDIPATMTGAMNTITDTLITPFGDYTLFSF